MIGDSKADAALARAVHCPLILVSFGYCREPVSSLGATRIVDAMSALPEAVRFVAAASVDN
jgi:phosphoglycolate phosphatase-like HAD superfamily hydrolase